MSERKPKCPICRREVEDRSENKAFPFCSKHCQMVDLGNWINEEYRMPIDHTATERSLPSETDEDLH